MKNIIEKLLKIERETSAEKGDYNLFALFIREGSSNRWDLLVSANWITKKTDVRHYLAKRMQASFEPGEIVHFSRIIIIEKDNPDLAELQEAVAIEHGSAELKCFDFSGQSIERAYLITSKRNEAA